MKYIDSCPKGPGEPEEVFTREHTSTILKTDISESKNVYNWTLHQFHTLEWQNIMVWMKYIDSCPQGPREPI